MPVGTAGIRSQLEEKALGFLYRFLTQDVLPWISTRLDVQGDITFTTVAKGPVIRSPNGNSWRLVVDNVGAVSSVLVP